MNRTNLIIFILVILLGGLGLAIYFQNKPVPEQEIQSILPPPPPEPIKNPIVHYPVLEPVTDQTTPPSKQEDSTVVETDPQLPSTLPPVTESDQSIREALKSLFGGKPTSKLLFMENIIQRFVATVDNLPEKRLPRAHLPLKTPGGKFLTAGTLEAPQTSKRNYKRYDAYVILLESINYDLAIKIYSYFYPLFQTAYEQLGYKNAYFNDRLVHVIDHLLETPNPPDPIQLSQPSVLFTYADPTLENLSSGQKILLRIGQEQRLRTLKVLSIYRDKLTNLHP